ncbi:MAG: hypothetical protein ACT4O1_14295 [Gemmatimonadota bacterium]
MKLVPILSACLTIATLTGLAGCNRAAQREAEQRAANAEARLAQHTAVAAEKDSLLNELMTTTSFINEIHDELATFKSARGKTTVSYQERVMPVAEYRAAMLERIRELGTRLADSEARLKASEARLRATAGQNKEMLAQVDSFKAMAAQYHAIVEEQRAQIELLTAQVQTLEADNARLFSEKSSLTEQVTDLTTEANTVYYVIGSKKELVERGVASEEGGSRFLFVGPKGGRTLVPARELEEADFTAIDKTVEFEIALPNPEKKYAIVSRHNPELVEPQPAKDGTWRGKIRIQDPATFWAHSKFLILVEK